MWSDNETTQDFLNFRSVAATAAELIVRANGRPLSVGVSGGWGVGKSSMVRLIQESLIARFPEKFVFVDFNAWLYQGYDDAKAALMDVIASRLVAHAEKNTKGLEKAKDLFGRINWVRSISIAGSIAATAAGFPAIGLIGELLKTARSFADGVVTESDMADGKAAGEKVVKEGAGLIQAKRPESPPKAIHDLRTHFTETLREMGVTLVVFVDDLDRCLPETAISTLEAMRLFLFLEQTAFVIAADEKMIRFAVRAHFKDAVLEEDLVTNYFDKLIQIPLRVPPLGTQEVRAYLFLLFIENSGIPDTERDTIRKAICKQLAETWQGKRVDREFVESLIPNCEDTLVRQLELADRIAPLMTTSRHIGGNPRLIKRFLNTLHIRLATAAAQQVTVDEAALTKMLILERCGHEDAYKSLLRAIVDSPDGKPHLLKPWEESVAREEEPELPPEWKDEFVVEWLALAPALHAMDLRSVVYVSRDYLPIISSAEQLSPEAVKLLEALFEVKMQAPAQLVRNIKNLGQRDKILIMEQLLNQARQHHEWGTPGILHAALAVVEAEESVAEALVRFLKRVPPVQLKAGIVPLLKDKPWARTVLDAWSTALDPSSPVWRAIAASKKS